MVANTSSLVAPAMGARSKLIVLYASQTGNAQDVAERIGREAELLKLDVSVISMDAYHVSQLPHETTVIFVVSTTGQGDPPDSMKSFWKLLLRRNLGSSWLDGLEYAVFGLGDSGYLKYNIVAKKLDRRLMDLGAKPIVDKGLGDDQHPSGYEAALDGWLVSLWSVFRIQFHLPIDLVDSGVENVKTDHLHPPKFLVHYHKLSTDVASNGLAKSNSGHQDKWLEYNKAYNMLQAAIGVLESSTGDDGSRHGPSRPLLARMVCNDRLTEDDHEQDVRHIEFDIKNTGIHYAPGDVLAVMPIQDEKVVDAFLKRCSLDPDTLIKVETAKTEHPASMQHRNLSSVARPVSIQTIVEHFLDVSSASPRRYFFEVMSHFATAEHEKERLKYFSTSEGRDELYQYNQRERRTVLEVLEDFPSVQLPLEWLLQLVPRLQPRYFSISSSMLAHPHQVHITVAVVTWQTPFKRMRHGLCSTWLSKLEPGKGEVLVPIWVCEGALKLPPASIPLLLVGPGTGCAPFRAFLEERAALSASKSVAPILFFFGCRKEGKDFLYRNFWLAQKINGILSEEVGGGFFVAFSRDQPTKVYVQHKIIEESKKVWRILCSGGSVYIAGSANKMPTDVASALEEVVAKEGNFSKDLACRWLKQLERVGKYHVETWS